MCGPLSWITALEEEERLSRRINAHLIIRDYPSAVQEAAQSLARYPTSASLHEGYIRALARSGAEKQCLGVWRSYAKSFPDKAIANRDLIEEIAWGVLQKAAHSSSILMREMALLAAFFSQDAKGVAILSQSMRDSNYAVRGVAVKLAGHCRDQRLITDVQRLFYEEKVWAVRQELIEAMGKMKAISFKPHLEALIASDQGSTVEKSLAIRALLELLDSLNPTEVDHLSCSSHAGLRQLACQAIAHFQSLRDLDRLWKLAQDPHQDVRMAAFQAIGQLRPKEQVDRVVEMAKQGVKDRLYQVAISAAWLLTLYEPEAGGHAFTSLLRDERREVRTLAAAAIAATGSCGKTYALSQYQVHPDPYVRLNLAVGLIGQRVALRDCGAFIRKMVVDNKEKWSTREVGIFRVMVNRSPKKGDDLLATPEEEDQLLRLEWLQLLAVLEVPNIQESLHAYLSERSWEISATAAALLLNEGDEAAGEQVQQLLDDPQPRVRLQAALILSLWSREEKAIRILEEGYVGSHWELKARILEGLGRIGSMNSVPFLLQVLQEPSQTLRLIAAMALIQCLNH